MDRWTKEQAFEQPGFPWRVTITFANRDGQLVVTRVDVSEREGSPPGGITATRLRELALGQLVGRFWRESGEQKVSVEPSDRKHRLPDEYLRQLVARRWLLERVGEPTPRKRLAQEFGRTPIEIRNHLTAARRRGLAIERLPDELPDWIEGLLVENVHTPGEVMSGNLVATSPNEITIVQLPTPPTSENKEEK
ncbi:MAG: hypothetical protein M3Q23_13365 [Actinomycetota bacterium]|nr:hypothetical protein [Actinomycetota bacterium]